MIDYIFYFFAVVGVITIGCIIYGIVDDIIHKNNKWDDFT